ncbi:WhiB family transcriptional regulator [Streptomyces sp. NPDC087901]|uniref:WhiB family transcriptional regulator n=1 Tax=Streptomyces sp. NPDC087901 TaxID=3365818 RepID=UPI00381FF565
MSIPPFLTRLNSRVPCTEQPNLFHPPDDGYNDLGPRGRERTDRAIALCGRCEAMPICREWARKQGEFGIWGAETDAERTAAGHPSRVHGIPMGSRATVTADKTARTDQHAREQRPDSALAAPAPLVPPRLTPTERSVLLALCEGVDAADLRAELARSQTVVMRALVGLQRKLGSDLAGLPGVARKTGLLSPRRPAA